MNAIPSLMLEREEDVAGCGNEMGRPVTAFNLCVKFFLSGLICFTQNDTVHVFHLKIDLNSLF